jgi:hypothetical protein
MRLPLGIHAGAIAQINMQFALRAAQILRLANQAAGRRTGRAAGRLRNGRGGMSLGRKKAERRQQRRFTAPAV